MTTSWDPGFCDRSPIFEPLRAAAGGLRGGAWPACGDLNRVAATLGKALVNACGKPVRFVAQRQPQRQFEDRYEPRIFLGGEVQVRACDWHDLFNALVWMTFPAAKAALNARHYRALEQQRASGAANRGPVQDTLTLFDEGGVVVAAGDAGLAELLARFEWKELFWRRRAAVAHAMRFYIFGHALYEKALQPFAGVTGRGVICDVATDFFAQPLASQLSVLDTRLAARIADRSAFANTRELVPVPILGVPGWCADNERESYYDNIDYFRAGRRSG